MTKEDDRTSGIWDSLTPDSAALIIRMGDPSKSPGLSNEVVHKVGCLIQESLIGESVGNIEGGIDSVFPLELNEDDFNSLVRRGGVLEAKGEVEVNFALSLGGFVGVAGFPERKELIQIFSNVARICDVIGIELDAETLVGNLDKRFGQRKAFFENFLSLSSDFDSGLLTWRKHVPITNNLLLHSVEVFGRSDRENVYRVGVSNLEVIEELELLLGKVATTQDILREVGRIVNVAEGVANNLNSEI